MDIIKKIEIKHFRSFDGANGKPHVSIEHLGDFNVFSGANDSGKSNVLRALNLFFNNEVANDVPFNKDRDFSKIASSRFDDEIKEKREKEKRRITQLKAEGTPSLEIKQRDLRRSDEITSIKIFFNNYNEQRGLPTTFWVSKSYSKKNNFEGEYNYQTDLKGNAQLSLFLKSFRYEYVPAIKDRDFFNHLFKKLQTYLFEKEDKRRENKFSETSRNFNEALTSETKQLFEKFKESTGVDANFHIPSTLVDFFRTLSVKTENDVSLFERGDGIQARFIPEILEEICSSGKSNVIWGFEEPENSYETKNIRKIRDDFLNNYSKTKQIFITSHTKEFLSVTQNFTKEEQAIKNSNKFNQGQKKEKLRALPISKKSSSISIYRVWKDIENKEASLITRFDENNGAWQDTCDDLGLVQEARIVDELQSKISQQDDEIKESKLSLEQKKSAHNEVLQEYKKCVEQLKDANQIIKEYQKPILVVEDKHDAIYKIAYLKTIGENISIADYLEKFDDKAPFIIWRAEGAGAVSGLLRVHNTDAYVGKKLVGLFDFDAAGSENFYNLKDGNNWDNVIQGTAQTGFYKKRNQHDCFFGLLLPVPERHLGIVADITRGNLGSYVEIENLLPDDFLNEHDLVIEEQITGPNTYKKINPAKKGNMKNCLVNADANVFSDFKPLFLAIGQLFNIQMYND